MRTFKFLLWCLLSVLMTMGVMSKYSKFHPVGALSLECLYEVRWAAGAIWLALLVVIRPWSSEQ